MSHYGPPKVSGYPGPRFSPPQPAPRRALPVLSIVGVTLAAMIVGGLIGGDMLLTSLSPNGGFAALGRGLIVSALAFAAWIAVIVGLVRHRSQRAVYRAPECLIGIVVLALISLWCVIHMATIELKRPTRMNTASTSPPANTGPPNSTNDATSPASSATTAPPSESPQPPMVADAHEIPDTNGRVPIDPCEWRFSEPYLAASPGTPFQPIGGNSRLAIEFGHTANSYEVRVIDLTSDKRQPVVAIQPFAAEVPRIADGGSANPAPFVVAASPDGRHVAIVDRSTRDAPADGRLLGAFLYPKVGAAGRWVSSTELLADNQLVDVALETTVWRYTDGVPSHTASVPSGEVRAAIDAGKAKQPAWVTTINAFALRVVAAPDLPLRESFTRRVTEQLERWAHEAGVRIDPASPHVLRVDLTQIEYRLDPSAVDPDEEVSLAMQNALLADFARRSIFRRYGYLHSGFGSSASHDSPSRE